MDGESKFEGVDGGGPSLRIGDGGGGENGIAGILEVGHLEDVRRGIDNVNPESESYMVIHVDAIAHGPGYLIVVFQRGLFFEEIIGDTIRTKKTIVNGVGAKEVVPFYTRSAFVFLQSRPITPRNRVLVEGKFAITEIVSTIVEHLGIVAKDEGKSVDDGGAVGLCRYGWRR